MMYESPIFVCRSAISAAIEDEIYKEVVKVGVNVDKDELLKALAYDRAQYGKGYADGRAETQKWISVEEKLPKKNGSYIGATSKGAVYSASFRFNGLGEGRFSTPGVVRITHWMPLPEPPEEDAK